MLGAGRSGLGLAVYGVGLMTPAFGSMNALASQLPIKASTPRGRSPVRTGAERLVESGFAPLQGLRVGLVANRTSQVRGERVLDLMHAAPGVTVAAVFTPEHGFDANTAAGAKVADGTDRRTAVPLHSLYGATRKPTPAMLRGLDVLVYDIQDVGVRAFTYISTLALVMQAASAAGIPVMVLDRPNPLGGERIEGFALDASARSFVGQFNVPFVYGLTVGELAHMIRNEALMPGLTGLQLSVVHMEGWRRQMLWPGTGLDWTPPSPNLPTFESALVYPGTVLFEATAASEGRGTSEPFVWVGLPGVEGAKTAARMRTFALPGAQFTAEVRTPLPVPGAAPNPQHRGRRIEGVRVLVQDADVFSPTATGVHLMAAFRAEARAASAGFVTRAKFLKLLAGTDRLWRALRQGTPPSRIVEAWQPDVEAFRERRKPYLVYPE